MSRFSTLAGILSQRRGQGPAEFDRPTDQALNIEFTIINADTLIATWDRGNGNGVLGIVTINAPLNAEPQDGEAYSADANYGDGDAIGNGRVVYNGTGVGVIITGVDTVNDTIYLTLREYNGIVPSGPSPENINPPVISGIPAVDALLSVDTGTWNYFPVSFQYQWKRDDVNIIGATNNTYTPTIDDVDAIITCDVTAINSDGQTTVTTYWVGPISTQTAPINTAAPVVSGTARYKETLSVTNGTWINDPTSFTYQWKKDGVAISGQTGSTYIVRYTDVESDISCEVTAVNDAGSIPEDSNALEILYETTYNGILEYYTAQTITPPDLYGRQTDNLLIKELSPYWSSIDGAYFLGTLGGSAVALLNNKNLGNNIATLHGAVSPVHTPGVGFTGNPAQSAYINLNFNPSTHGVGFAGTDASIIVVSETASPSANGALIACSGSAALHRTGLAVTGSQSGLDYHISQGNGGNVALGNFSGVFHAKRTSSTAMEVHRNGSSISTFTSAIAGTKANFNLYALARNNNGTAADFYGGTISLILIGASLVGQESNINTAIQLWNAARASAPGSPPNLLSAVIEDAEDDRLQLEFSEAVDITTAGWSVSTDGDALSISSVTGSGTTTPYFTLSRSVLSTETITISYDPDTGATEGSVSEIEIEEIIDFEVDNNVAGIVFDEDYQDYLDYLTANTITLPDAEDRPKQNARVIANKASGAWAECDLYYDFRDSNIDAARVNIKAPGVCTISIVGTGITYSKTKGFESSSTSGYLNTHFNPSTFSSPNYVQNDAGIVLFTVDGHIAGGSAETHWAHFPNAQPRLDVQHDGADGNFYGGINNGTNRPNLGANSPTTGMYHLRRTASNAYALYRNGTLFNSNTQTSGAVPNDELLLLRTNTTGQIGNISFLMLGSAMDGIESTIYDDYSATP